jgi:hypothetical protein
MRGVHPRNQGKNAIKVFKLELSAVMVALPLVCGNFEGGLAACAH